MDDSLVLLLESHLQKAREKLRVAAQLIEIRAYDAI